MILFSTLFPQGKSLKDIIVEGSKRVLFGTCGDTLIYDTQASVEWLDPYVNVAYDISLKAEGETVTPTINAYQEQNKKGYSGKTYRGDTYYNYNVSYSIISNNSAFTLDTKTGAVTCTNNTTTSSRQFQIKVSVTLLDSTTTIDRLITFTQAAGSQSISNSEWTTTGITVDNLTFTAASGSKALTTNASQRRTKNIYWNGVLTDTTTETRTTAVTATYTENSDWFSISSSIVTVNSNQLGSARSANVTASYGGYTATAVISQNADSVQYWTYDAPTITYFEYDSYASGTSGSSVSPSVSYYYYGYPVYYSGYVGSGSRYTSGATLSFSEYSGSTSSTSVNSSGKVTWNSANTGSSSRSIEVKLTVSTEGGSDTAYAYCYQNPDDYIINSYYTYDVVIAAVRYTSSGNGCPVGGGNTQLSWAAEKTLVNEWSSGRTTYGSTEDVTDEVSVYGSAEGFNKNGNIVTISSNAQNSSTRSCTYYAYIDNSDGYFEDSVTIYQKADSKSLSSTYYEISFSASSTTISASGGTVTLNCTGTKYSEYTWASGGTTTEESSFTPSISGSADGFTLNSAKTKVTVSANSSYTSTRSVTYTASYSGATSKSVTITQSAKTDSIKSYGTPVISVGSGLTAAGGSATISVSQPITYESGSTDSISISASNVSIKSQFKSTSWMPSSGTTISRFSKSGSTLSHTSMGTDNVYDYCILTVTANGQTGTKQVYVSNGYEYSQVSDISISNFSYPNNAANTKDATTSPTVPTIKITKYDVYTSGAQTGSSTVTASYYTLNYSLSSSTYFSINSSTGVCTTTSANTGNARSATVTVTVTLTSDYRGTTTKTKTATVTQAAKSQDPTYKATINYSNGANCYWILTNSSSQPSVHPSGFAYSNQSSVNITYTDSLTVHTYNGGVTQVPVGGMVYIWYNETGNANDWVVENAFTHQSGGYTVNF